MAALINDDEIGINPTHCAASATLPDGTVIPVRLPIQIPQNAMATRRALKNLREAIPGGLDQLLERIEALEEAAYSPSWGNFSGGGSQGSFTPGVAKTLTWGTFLSDGSGQISDDGDHLVLATIGAYYITCRVRIDPTMSVALSLTPSSTSTVELAINQVSGSISTPGGSSIVYGYNGFKYEQNWTGLILAQTDGAVIRTQLTINSDFSDADVATISWFANYLGDFV